MKKTMIYLEDYQYRQLKREAENSKKGMAMIIREAVNEYFKTRQKKINYKEFVGIAQGPVKGSVSERVEEVLREEMK